ncbi:MAG TPA: nucleoside-diphosphate sugar epimerase/dehydratase [Acidimicrobiales bacterium]|nr:nucleoside-diphosphate sugar epimerase/dehydratase [Acidimicrobiales bacterium]
MQQAIKQLVLEKRYGMEGSADAAVWAFALVAAAFIRLDFHLAPVPVAALLVVMPLAAVVQVLVGVIIGLYAGTWRYGSFDEVAGLARAAVLTSLLTFGLNLALPVGLRVPRTVPLGAGAIALVLMAGIRYGWRLAWERGRRPSGDHTERLLVFGAGEGGVQVITAMLRDPASPYVPVGLLDDDPRKRNLRVMGIRVAGTKTDLSDVARRTGATSLLVAIPSASRDLVAEMADGAAAAGLTLKVLPPVRELFGAPGLSDIRDLNPADLLGRHEIETDLASIAGYLTGKRVLVTGAGGSIGSELCRQISRFSPADLIMLDRDESALHAIQLSLEGRALLDTPNLVLADIRDGKRLEAIFAERRPEVVFHAAALKHLTLLERNPGEALQTNVWGTLNVLLAAAANGVERFVNISTDKAADPTSVLGASKRIAECLTAYVTQNASGTYLSVRFGNVLGSRGSMLGTFQAQIVAGGPVTVTDPEVTRFFMTIQEAVELVIQAGAIGRNGQALVLDMGEPVKIADVARRLVAQADCAVQIVFTGLRPGEKLHEVLLGAGEADDRPVHPLISHVAVPRLGPELVLKLDPSSAAVELARRLEKIAGDAEPARL